LIPTIKHLLAELLVCPRAFDLVLNEAVVLIYRVYYVS